MKRNQKDTTLILARILSTFDRSFDNIISSRCCVATIFTFAYMI